MEKFPLEKHSSSKPEEKMNHAPRTHLKFEMGSSVLLRALGEVRRYEAKKASDYAKLEGDTSEGLLWSVYRSRDAAPAAYMKDFERVIKGDFNSFQSFAAERKKAGLAANALDLMGPGFCFLPPESERSNFDTITAVCLSESLVWHALSATEYSRARDEFLDSYGYRVLTRNVYHKNFIRELKEFMREVKIPSFDVITCLPAGPFAHGLHDAHFLRKPHIKEAYCALYFMLLKKIYELLTPEGGVLLTQVPFLLPKSKQELASSISAWCVWLTRHGLTAEAEVFPEPNAISKIKIVRRPGSPERFPSDKEMVEPLLADTMIYE